MLGSFSHKCNRAVKFLQSGSSKHIIMVLASLRTGERFNSMIPELISKIESGWFPIKQAGHYDLNLDWWI